MLHQPSKIPPKMLRTPRSTGNSHMQKTPSKTTQSRRGNPFTAFNGVDNFPGLDAVFHHKSEDNQSVVIPFVSVESGDSEQDEWHDIKDFMLVPTNDQQQNIRWSIDELANLMPVEFTPGGLHRQQSPTSSEENITPRTRSRRQQDEACTQAQLNDFFSTRAVTPATIPRRPPSGLLFDLSSPTSPAPPPIEESNNISDGVVGSPKVWSPCEVPHRIWSPDAADVLSSPSAVFLRPRKRTDQSIPLKDNVGKPAVRDCATQTHWTFPSTLQRDNMHTYAAEPRAARVPVTSMASLADSAKRIQEFSISTPPHAAALSSRRSSSAASSAAELRSSPPFGPLSTPPSTHFLMSSPSSLHFAASPILRSTSPHALSPISIPPPCFASPTSTSRCGTPSVSRISALPGESSFPV
eukprot:m.100036 g.100036  ORF g.100036 m.100036 type:complete len:410 (+) comp16773_c0_seq1:288-1517(+)